MTNTTNVNNFKRIQFQLFVDEIQQIIEESLFKKQNIETVRLLEIGCGPGDFALLLKERLQDKIEITAIDPSDDIDAALKKSTGNDVYFERNDIFNFKSSDPFDLILFTKSLHHCIPVEQALKNTLSMLKPNGLIVAEEINVNRFTTKHVAWFYDRLDLILAAGCLKPVEETLAAAGHTKKVLTRFLNPSLPYEQRWFRPIDDQHKDSGLHRDDPEGIMAPSQLFQTVENELGKENIRYLHSALLYHFLSFAGLKQDKVGEKVLEEFIKQEQRAINESVIPYLGTSIIYQKP